MDRNGDDTRVNLALGVALRKESVDRNISINRHSTMHRVALRKESVDRNLFINAHIVYVAVALRKESVDRNKMEPYIITIGMGSLSARRAWIEMTNPKD